MKKLVTLFVFSFFSTSVFANIPDLRLLSPDVVTIKEDLNRILEKAQLSGLDFSYQPGSTNQASVQCQDGNVHLAVTGDHQWSQTFYMALQRLGFLFPHPRMQISPSKEKILSHCGESYTWNPVLKYSGLHLHTLHPSEWVHGFLLGQQEIAIDTVRWLARTQQNIFDLSLLRQKKKIIWANLKQPFALAKKFGIHTGVTLGAALHQQNSFKLVSLLATFFDRASLRELSRNLEDLLNNVDVSFVNMEMGTSEFTPVNYPRMIKWMNRSAEITDKRGVALVVKVHVSTNQNHAKYGNFNFLPQYADPRVGILPHTVYLYGLGDDSAPMYGNKDFKHMLKFMQQEKDKRRTWFYPENSYYIALDIDTGLLLTDYLLVRAEDNKILDQNNIEGQIVFTTGQEVGYWLFDWTSALLNNRDYNFDPLIGLKLLGEDVDSWSKIVEFQNEYFKKKGMLSIVTFNNFGDEMLPGTHTILKRNSLKALNKNPQLIQQEISQLEDAIAHIPQNLTIKNEELRLMVEATFLRLHHALATRRALLNKAELPQHLAQAVTIRGKAQSLINQVRGKYNRYPSAQIWNRHKNPTAYPYGYAFSVKNLHYWFREEEVIRTKNFSPFFMNITDWADIIFKKAGTERKNFVEI